MIKVVLYARVSSDDIEQEKSVANQLEILEKEAQRRGVIVYKKGGDEGYSGSTDDRPFFQEIITEALKPNPPFQEIWVTDFSRFARNLELSIILKKQLAKNNVKVVAISQPLPNDSEISEFIERIYELIDEQYIKKTKRATLLALINNAKKGIWNGGEAPFGYQVVDKKLVLHPVESAIAQQIFQLALMGKSTRYICQYLNNCQIKPRHSKFWTPSTIYSILKNKVYTGAYIWNRSVKNVRKRPVEDWIVIPNHHPAIVTEEEWLKIQELLKSRSGKFKYTHPKLFENPYLLSGKIFCGICGDKYYVRSGRKYKYYQCKNKRTANCTNISLSVQKIDSLITQYLIERILTYDFFVSLLDDIDEQLHDTTLIQQLLQKINNLQNRKERFKELFVDNLITRDELKQKITEIEQEIQNITHQLNSLQGVVYLKSFNEQQLRLLLQKIKDIIIKNPKYIRDLIKKVIVFPNKIKIEGVISAVIHSNDNALSPPVLEHSLLVPFELTI